LESERRKAIIIVEEVERTVNHFKNKWLKDATDDHVDSWIDLLSLAKEHAGMPKCNTVEEFGQELLKIRKHEALVQNKELVTDMLKIVERAKIFDAMIPNIHNKLQGAFPFQYSIFIVLYCFNILVFSFQGKAETIFT
jgi:hypothetical protein